MKSCHRNMFPLIVSALWVASSCISSGGFPVKATVSGTDLQIEWGSSTSMYYKVHAKSSLNEPWALVRGMVLGSDGQQAWQDKNAIHDFDQLFYQIVARPTSSPADEDNDGLNDVAELQGGFNPTKSDTDDDGILDGADPRPGVPNEAPAINTITVTGPANFHHSRSIELNIAAVDPDGDAMAYRYAVDYQSPTSWTSSSTLTWTPDESELGAHTLTISSQDPWLLSTSQSYPVYVFRCPPLPE